MSGSVAILESEMQKHRGKLVAVDERGVFVFADYWAFVDSDFVCRQTTLYGTSEAGPMNLQPFESFVG